MRSRPALVFFISVGITNLSMAQPVVFNDANLKAAVESVLSITNPDTSDMLGLTYLYADNNGISHNLAYLARSGYDVDSEWIGAIHAFNIYKRALTEVEIANLFTAGSQ